VEKNEGGKQRMSGMLRYADELTITVRRVKDALPGQNACETYYVNFTPTAGNLNGEEIRTTLFNIAQIDGMQEGIALQENRTTLEWGASASAWHYVVELAASLDEALIGAAVQAALSKIASLAQASRSAEPLSRDSALHFAKQTLLINTPSLSHKDLTVHSEEEDRKAGSWSFSFRPDDGYEYEARIEHVGEMPNVTRIRRSRL
jgi:hypothetical protein